MDSSKTTSKLQKRKLESVRRDSPPSDPSSSFEPSSSLLDILIKAEQEIQQNEEVNDPLEAIGDIGDAVINQLAGKTLREALGEVGNGEDVETVNTNALKLFDEAMSYSKPTMPPKRKYTRWKTQNERKSSADPTISVQDQLESIAKQTQISQVKHRNGNLDLACTETFEDVENPNEKAQMLHTRFEEQRNQFIANEVAKDVERLLGSASKLHGMRQWTDEEKLEFGKYCKNLRSNRGLSMEDRMGIQNFYAKAYDLDEQTASRSSILFYEEFRKANGMPPGIISPLPAPLPTVEKGTPLKRKSNHKKEESIMYPKPEKISVREETPEDSAFSIPKATLPFTPFHPGMKYEKEKVFRSRVIDMFLEIFMTDRELTRRKPGRPKMVSRPAVPEEPAEPETTRSFSLSTRNEREDMEWLMGRLNEVMEDQKVWTQEDIDGLKKFYDSFRGRMTFTIIQTKELGNYLRKVYGKLEPYEVERANDAKLQEKRKYWQEYKKTHVPVRKAAGRPSSVLTKRLTPVRPYIKSGIDTKGESEAEKKARKAAYLREWRIRRAEKQSVDLSTQLLSINSKLHFSTEAHNSIA